jgi:hypothetical protein
MLLARLAGAQKNSFQQAADGSGFAVRPTPARTLFYQSFPNFPQKRLAGSGNVPFKRGNGAYFLECAANSLEAMPDFSECAANSKEAMPDFSECAANS